MNVSRILRGASSTALLFLAACGGESSFDIELVTRDCQETIEHLAARQGTMTVVVSGDGMSDIKREGVNFSDGALDLPEVPVGSNRVVTVSVFEGKNLSARGRSEPFEVTSSGAPSVRVQLFRANAFTTWGEWENDTTCKPVRLAGPRAGHTATRLKDGRVLIAGGFSSLDKAGTGAGYLSTAEIFDPVTGAISSAGTVVPHAFAQSVLLRDGRVLIVGGTEMKDQVEEVTDTASIFDPATGAWSQVKLQNARKGHTVTLVAENGPLLVVGGVGADGKVVETIEVFDAKANTFSPVKGAAKLARAYHVAANVGLNNAAVEIAGGIDDSGVPETRSQFIVWNRDVDTITVSNQTVALPTGTVRSGVALFDLGNAGRRLGVIGGAKTWTPEAGKPGVGKPSGASNEAQWIGTDPSQNKSGTLGLKAGARVNPCVVGLDAKRALVLGGFSETQAFVPGAEVLAWQDPPKGSNAEPTFGSDKTEKLRDDGRGYTSCTDLGDGRVLVVGGIGKGGAAVSTAEIYLAQPPPASEQPAQ
ncbi:Kelch repeat-containing protein [Vulgatibacter incomptus]|uniref:Kelch domain protein n=1 Tax=Vulgatibacter incomptus TaxID=1391653 RepID=A0A0K1PER9_9BACT|nr:kelch repeat-containing protein [Vulgatibacter incomptus]AKU91911.1 kelch domain protein [Vulgatibacter incomptus]